jgi:hypothetical protein
MRGNQYGRRPSPGCLAIAIEVNNVGTHTPRDLAQFVERAAVVLALRIHPFKRAVGNLDM